MTTAGMYGTLLTLDTEENIAMLEIAPNVIVKMHSQAIRHAVTPVEDEAPDDDEEVESDGVQLNTSSAIPMAEPEFGERTQKPARKKPSPDSQ